MSGFGLALQVVCIIAALSAGWMMAKAEEHRDRMLRNRRDTDDLRRHAEQFRRHLRFLGQ